jgi:glyoxylase-like metal-dependent hydrolase (beta-lactamase superfamily II)
MKVHHLVAATLCPVGARLINGAGGHLDRGRLICHVLLIETEDGLVLVDTGLGTGDIINPGRLGPPFLLFAAPVLDPDETALAQVKALGFSPDDVRHVVMTHLDLDHAGGLSDFPRAKVHVHAREHEAAMARATFKSKGRYIPDQWKHGPLWQPHSGGGESWFGFDGVKALTARETDVLLIPLFGHTLGHCGVAVRTGDTWLLHAGDSYFFHGQMERNGPPVPGGLALFQKLVDTDRPQRVANQARLRELAATHGGEVTIFCAHDPVEHARCAAGAGRR